METARLWPIMVTGMILLTTFASGPGFGIYRVEHQDSINSSLLGTGNATVSNVILPASATLSSGSFNTESFTLRVPEALTTIGNVSGRPMLIYRIDIDEIGFSRTSMVILEPGMNGQFTFELPKTQFELGDIRFNESKAKVSIVLRGTGTDRELGSRNVTVEVDR